LTFNVVLPQRVSGEMHSDQFAIFLEEWKSG